jgi:hypothetical protein
MEKKTAVEWLVEKLSKNGVLHSSDIHTALKMEKEQKGYSIEEISSKFVGEGGETSIIDEYFDYCMINEIMARDAPTFKEWFLKNKKI